MNTNIKISKLTSVPYQPGDLGTFWLKGAVCVISKVVDVDVIYHDDEDKTTTDELFKKLRFEIFQFYVIYDGWLSEISSMKTRKDGDGWAL